MKGGFTKVDVVVVTAIISFLLGAGTPYLRVLGAKMKINRCRDNLRQLGVGMAVYEKDNDSRIPYASLMYSPQVQSTWDTLIRPIVRAKIEEKATVDTVRLNEKVANVLLCPLDVIPVADWAQKYEMKRRSYAITRHDMRPANWPPGPENATGIGLSWLFRGRGGENGPSPDIYNYDETNKQAAVRMNMIAMPGKTMILTELMHSNNIARNASRAWIDRTADHFEPSSGSPERFHNGKFNYLMVDGNVASLPPDETVGPNGEAGDNPQKHFGLWTIRGND